VSIERYVLVDKQGIEGDWEYETFQEAQAAADDRAIIMRTYEYDDSELVWTPDGSNTWPPKRK
jgi:hypothetical protein